MGDKLKDSGRLKLRNTDTNRFKVDTGRLRVQPTPEAASEVSKHKAGETQQNEVFVDPISLRDTSTSKLKRLDGPGAVGTTVTPASLAPEKKSETVRLKVVRATPRPGTLPPSAAPLANVPLSAPVESEKREAPASPEAAPKLTVPEIKLPPKPISSETFKPGATTNIAAEYPQEPIVGDQVPPSAAKVFLQKPAVEDDLPSEPTSAKPSAAPGLSTDTASLQVPPPAKPSAAPGLSTDTASLQVPPPAKPAADVVPTSTIKLSIKKPEGAPLPPSAATPPAPAAEPAAPAKLPSTATTGLKIRPAAGSGGTVVAPAPAADGGQTVPVAPPPAASATVKVSPAAVLPPSTGAKISLKKDPEPAAPETGAGAPAEPATPSSSTVAVKMPVAEDSPADPAKKGLRLSGKAGKTVSVPAPGSPAKKPEDAAAQAKEEGAPEEMSAPQPEQLPALGISTLESISAIAASVVLAVTLFSLLMSLIKQM
jgi:hypothetical protein